MHKLPRYSRNLGLIAGLLLCTSMATTPAMADLITFNFTGYVSKVGDKLSDGTIHKHQYVTGSYTFNTETLDNNPSNNRIGEYNGALNGPITNFTVTIGTYDGFLGIGANEIEVKNLRGLSHDSYEVEGALYRYGDQVNGYKPKSFELELEHLKHSSTFRFNGDDLPSVPPDLSAFKEKTLRLEFGYGGHDKSVLIHLKTLTAVPLPPAVILFGAGLVALIGLGARSWRKVEVKV